VSFLSIKFFLLFLVVFYTYWNVNNKYKRLLLLISSCIFYSFFSVNFLLHFLFVITVNYLLIRFTQDKSYFLKLTVGFNLLNLFLFKYFYFFLETIGFLTGIKVLTERSELNQYFSSISHIANFEVILPMTISYYTFQLISLSVDIHKKTIDSPVGFYDIASYTLFFPVMIAGPITRYKDVLPAMESPSLTKEDMFEGLWKILLGITKKVALSDSIAAVIYPIFKEPENYSGFSILLTCYFFAIHLYLDFSGLTDIARGLGRLLGFNLPENFKAPFFLNSFSDFWRRWHLSFSFWIRDYIYIPLGGSRVSEMKGYLNLIITFVLGGLWHGASMNFIMWGFLTGVFLSVERFMEVKKINIIPENKFKPFLKFLFVFHVYMITWILFFTQSLLAAFTVIWRMVSFQSGIQIRNIEMGLYVVLFAMLFQVTEEFPEKFEKFAKWKRFILPIFSLVIVLLILNNSGNKDFFYEKF
jgi:alginate O-acetyltransferase complex protein AlgI